MKVSIFGLGYVGAVTGACFAKNCHDVIGVDPDPRKLDSIRAGKSPIAEEGLDELLQQVVTGKKLIVTSDAREAVAKTDVSLVCVGTPSRPDGSLQTDYVERVAQDIGRAIKAKGHYHSVVIRSTVLPGTTESLVTPTLEREIGGRAGEAFGVSMNPEFLREGTSIKDFYQPPMTVIGTATREEFERVAGLYRGLPGEVVHCRTATAEAMKYACNIYHAIKITYANEMGMLCQALGVDAREVMEIVCKDTKLNVSAKYLRPGFAFGGSCLPKDLRAFTSRARQQGQALPTFEAVLASNRRQIEATAQRILGTGCKRIALLGVAFKEGTDDLRESPFAALAAELLSAGCDVKMYDEHVKPEALYGANKLFMNLKAAFLPQMMVSADDALAHGEVVVFSHNAPAYRALVPKVRREQRVFDLAGIAGREAFQGSYEGLYW